jgi:hypothetical protein
VKGPAAEKLLRFWQKKLHLDDWDVTLVSVEDSMFETESGTASGHCARGLRGMTAVITVAISETKERVENTIVHELLHCLVAPMARESDRMAEYLPRATMDMCRDRLYDYEENVVDRMARVVIELEGRTSDATVRYRSLVEK